MFTNSSVTFNCFFLHKVATRCFYNQFVVCRCYYYYCSYIGLLWPGSGLDTTMSYHRVKF